MIPNLTIMIAAYIIWRAVQAMCEEVRQPNSSVLTIIGAVTLIVVTLVTAFDTVSRGSSLNGLTK